MPDLVQGAGPAAVRAGFRRASVVVGAPPRTASGPACARAAPGRCRRQSALQLAHRVVAHVVGRRAWRSASRRSSQVDDHALAQRAARRQQRVDAEVRGQRVQDRQPAGDHGAAVVASGRAARAGRCGRPARQPVDAPAQPVGRDAAVGDAAGGQQLRHRADRARRAQRLVPAAAARRAAALLPARRRRRSARRGRPAR